MTTSHSDTLKLGTFHPSWSSRYGLVVWVTVILALVYAGFLLMPVHAGATPPVITASCGPSTAGKPTACNASASGGVSPYTFRWDVGKDGSIDGTGPNFSVVFPVKGAFSLDAIVVDSDGASAFVNLPIIVRSQNLVITASCFPSTAGKPTVCTASASGGSAPYTFFWDVGKDGTIEGQFANFSVVFPVKGTFSVDAMVRDANNKTAFVNLPLAIRPQPLVITASCQPGTAGKPTVCISSASGGTGPYMFLWDVGKDGTIDGQFRNFSVVFPVKGTYSLDAMVIDTNNTTAFVNLPIIIRSQPLVVTASCQPGTAGKPTSCNVSASGGTTPYRFLWHAGGINTEGETFEAVFPTKGTFNVTAIVLDANNSTASVNLPIVVRPQPLVVSFASRCVLQPRAGVEYRADASGGTTPFMFAWDFGDGTTALGNPLNHTYSVGGLYIVKLRVTDANNATATVSRQIVACGNAVTDSSFCRLSRNQFRLIYITDPQNPATYRLTASNPGQFYDNVFFTGAAGDSVNLTLSMPFPFVTQGAVPIQVHDGVGSSNNCLVPMDDVTRSFTITAGAVLTPSGMPSVVLGDYTPQNFNSSVKIMITGNIPSSGLVYVTIHLDYGLKGTTGWMKGSSSAPFPAVNTGLGLTINDPQSYVFTIGGSMSSSATVTSTNVFKKDPGFAGVVTNSSGNPVKGVTVRILDSKMKLLASVVTDQDGYYQYQYKYTGAKAIYYVTVPGYNLYQPVIMQANKLVVVNFVSS